MGNNERAAVYLGVVEGTVVMRHHFLVTKIETHVRLVPIYIVLIFAHPNFYRLKSDNLQLHIMS